MRGGRVITKCAGRRRDVKSIHLACLCSKCGLAVCSFIPAFAASRAERVKGIRKIPPRGGILANTIESHPTPRKTDCGKTHFVKPPPLEGRGRCHVVLHYKRTAGVG